MVMRRRRFIKTLAAAATAIMIPLQLTEFGGAVSLAPPVVLAPFARIPLATIDASIKWMQLMYGHSHIAYTKEGLTHGVL